MGLYVTINNALKSQNAARKGKHLKGKWQEWSLFFLTIQGHSRPWRIKTEQRHTLEVHCLSMKPG